MFSDELLEIRPITDEERASISLRSFGVDAGSVHPWVFVEVGYERTSACCTCSTRRAARASRPSTRRPPSWVASKLEEAGDPAADVWCDSAARGMILYYQEQGISAQKRQAGPQLAQEPRQVDAEPDARGIDPDRCPLAAKEFPEYEYVANGQGDITETLPKVNDDAIDAAGYAAGLWIRSNL